MMETTVGIVGSINGALPETLAGRSDLNAPQRQVDVSFIIPMYNEVENIEAMLEEVTETGKKMNRPFEIILVDDGSTDGTVKKAKMLAKALPFLRVICLRRNFGQTAATSAGFDFAQGKYIVTLDGDLQNDPADVPKLVTMLEEEELDIISGWRKNRKDKAITRKLPSMIANRIIGWTTGVKIHDYGCSLKVYRAEVAKNVPMYGEMHRFIPALASIDGAIIKEVPVNHRPRMRGQSKYNLSRTFKVILDLMTVVFMKRFFTRPLHVFGRIGLALLFTGLVINLYLLIDKVFIGEDIGGRPLLFLGALMLLGGIQMITTGLIAEIQVRTYFESQQKPIYKVREIVGV